MIGSSGVKIVTPIKFIFENFYFSEVFLFQLFSPRKKIFSQMPFREFPQKTDSSGYENFK